MHGLHCEFRTNLKNLASLDLKIKIRRARDIASGSTCPLSHGPTSIQSLVPQMKQNLYRDFYLWLGV